MLFSLRIYRPPGCTAIVPMLAVVLLTVLASLAPEAMCGQDEVDLLGESNVNAADLVREVRILGNDTVASEQIASQLTTKVGRPFDRTVVQQDVRRLANLGWFVDVKPLYESSPQGHVVIFQVAERPTIRYVTYLGNEDVPDKKLAKETGLKSGGAVDPYAVEEARRKIEEYYQGRGYNKAQVTILEGTKPSDKGISFLIDEGLSEKIWNVEFVGNEFLPSSRLKTIIKSKPPVLKVLKGYFDRDQLDADVDLLTAYYRSFGYFQAKVSRKVERYSRKNWVQITFVISEGPRYKVRNVRFMGNTKFEPNALANAAKLKSGDFFEQEKMSTDAQWVQKLYGSHGYVFADVRPEPVFLEQPGEVDLIYNIDEGQQFRVGRIIVHIDGDNPHTRIMTAINRMSLRPGDIVDIREVQASERRLVASSLFHTDPATGVRPKITYRIPDDADWGISDEFSGGPGSGRIGSNPGGSPLRGQNPEPRGPSVLPPPSYLRQTAAAGRQVDVHIRCEDPDHYQRWLELEREGSPTPNGDRTEDASPPTVDEVESVIRGQSPSDDSGGSAWWVRPRRRPQRATPQNPYQSVRGQSPAPAPNNPYGSLGARPTSAYGGRLVAATDPMSKPPRTPSPVQTAQFTESIAPPSEIAGPTPGFTANPVPGYQVYPNGDLGFPGQPYPNRTVDIIFEGQETQTGRLQMGVGVNSNAGVIGNIVIDERNFDWRRVPRSFEDIRNGTAFRGAGQHFTINASPGSSVSRYLASFQEPYLFDTPISLGVSGSLFTRRYNDWDEERLGGRVSFGYQWLEHDLSTVASYRGESVEITNPSVPSQPDLKEALGANSLNGFKLAVINDTRDSTFLPTQGHYLELGGEQVIGSFIYPRIDIDFRTYWLLKERPDHSGRHVLSYATNVGYLGDDVPIYERFYAGGYSTLRGFRFRGASPVDGSVQIGGNFQWLNSLQYLFPITADEMLHGVLFCDFGTVERKVDLNNFRVAPGFGLRVTVPAMGPAPIALDFAFPVAEADTDREQVFSFSMGFSR